jgi:hypothetical protein
MYYFTPYSIQVDRESGKKWIGVNGGEVKKLKKGLRTKQSLAIVIVNSNQKQVDSKVKFDSFMGCWLRPP